jgi:hypothetical protein
MEKSVEDGFTVSVISVGVKFESTAEVMCSFVIIFTLLPWWFARVLTVCYNNKIWYNVKGLKRHFGKNLFLFNLY